MLGGAAYYDRAILEQQSLRLLAAFQLEKQAEMYPAALSYGQQQRVALVRALMFPAGLLLLDEPFTGLDDEARENAAALIRQRENGRIVIIASHDVRDAELLGAHIVELR